MSNHLSPSTSSGQSLVEVMIAMVVAVVVLGALIVVILNSLKNAQFAQNQAKATKYAQEAIDQVRNIRDQDGPVSVPGDTASCVSKFSNLWTYYLSSGNKSCSVDNSPCRSSVPGGLASDGCYFKLDQSNSRLYEPVGATLDSFLDSPELGFSRQIKLSDYSLSNTCPGSALLCNYQNEKILTVQVQWTDSSGTHQSNLQTILTKRI